MYACKEFGLTTSIKKTNVMGPNVLAPPSINSNNKVLEVTDHFTYLGSTVTSNLSLNTEIDKCIAEAAAVLSKLSKRVIMWNNNKLILNTKFKWRYIRCVSLAPCCMAVSPGQCTPDRRTAWKVFICVACNELWVSCGRIKSPMLLCLEKAGSLSMYLMLKLQTLTPLAWTCVLNGERLYTQWSPVWWTC